jgi:chorismate mutase
MKKILAFLTGCLLSTHIFSSCHMDKINPVVSLIGQRAGMIKAVAAYKWYHAPDHQATPYSAQREIKVLASVNSLAKKQDIDPLSLLIFTQIQMDISKQIETYWINYWNDPEKTVKGKPTKTTLKSLTSLRQQIEKLDASLFPLLKSAIPALQQCSVAQLRPVFNRAFAQVKGIPQQSDFMSMLIKSFKQITAN